MARHLGPRLGASLSQRGRPGRLQFGCNSAYRLGDLQRREFREALLDAGTFEDLPGKWQAAIVAAEQHRPKLRLVSRD